MLLGTETIGQISSIFVSRPITLLQCQLSFGVQFLYGN